MIGKQKFPSGHGDGKWQSTSTLASYRKKRNKKNAAQKKARAAARKRS